MTISRKVVVTGRATLLVALLFGLTACPQPGMGAGGLGGIGAILPLFFLWFLVIGIPFAIGNGFVASRLNRSVVLWVILSIIPIVNFIFMYYVFYVVLIHFLDKAKKISDLIEKSTVSE